MNDKSSKPSDIQLDTIKLRDESDYIQFCINGFKLVQERDYQNAGIQYKESLTIARKLEDDYKYSDSLCNYGITQFYSGKITEGIQNLESALRIIQKLLNISQERKYRTLYVKILSNLFLSYLSIAKISEANSHMNNLLDYIKSLENYEKQLKFLKQIIYIFFRVESLTHFIDKYYKYNFDITEKIEITEENKNSEEILNRISSKIVYFLHKYLREKDVDSWIKCLNDESENYKLLKDYNGFVFSIFNQYVSLYTKDPDNDLSKNKISNICKALSEKKNFEEKSITGILEEMKVKSETSIEVYKKLYGMEEDLEKKIEQDKVEKKNSQKFVKRNKIVQHDSKILFKIFLRFSLNYLNQSENKTNPNDENNPSNNELLKDAKYFKQLKNQINLTLDLIDKGVLDLSSLSLEAVDPELYEAFVLIGENLMSINFRNCIRAGFKKWRKNALQLTTNIKKKLYNDMLMEKLKKLRAGTNLLKLNFSSSGVKEHFYQLDTDEKTIKVFSKQGSKLTADILLNEITKFVYGTYTENIKNKLANGKNQKLNQPWLFFSFLINKKTVDFYLEEKNLNLWFYGIKIFLDMNEVSYKLISVNGFVLQKLKMKLIYELKEVLKNQTNPDKNLLRFKSLIENKNNSKICFY